LWRRKILPFHENESLPKRPVEKKEKSFVRKKRNKNRSGKKVRRGVRKLFENNRNQFEHYMYQHYVLDKRHNEMKTIKGIKKYRRHGTMND
jgi:hypothetical protein